MVLIMKQQKRDGGDTRGCGGTLMPALRSLLLIFILSAVSLSSRCQTYPYREYTIDDGLPQSETMAVFQDSRGYIWIPTRNGLARFDGQTFISYMRKDGLPSNIVTQVMEDRAGIVWVVTAKGLARFNGMNFKSYPFPDSLGIKTIGMGCDVGDPATWLLSGSTDARRNKIILFKKGRYYDMTTDHPALRDKSFRPSVFDNRDSTLYMTNARQEVYSYRHGVLKQISKGPASDVILTDDGPMPFNETEESKKNTAPFINETRTLGLVMTDREGTAWLTMESRIFRLISDAFIEYGRENGLPENTWALAADPSGGLWTGSKNGELKYFDGKQFISRDGYLKLYDEPPPFFRGSATLSNGEVWLSTGVGVLIWDGKRFRKLDLLPDPQQICIIYEDPVDGKILIGSDQGLHIIEGNKVTSYPQISWPEYGIAEGIARDHKGNYWIAGHYGITFFDGTDFIPLRTPDAPVEWVWGVLCDYRGTIWCAGSDGLFNCNPERMLFNKGLPEEADLPANVIRDMGDHKLLIGRMMDICIIDLEKYYSGQQDYYKIIDRTRGFTGNDCQDNGIVRDAAGYWWILASNKLIRFDPSRLVRNKFPPVTHITRVEVPGDTSDWVAAIDSSLFYHKNNSLNIRGRMNSVRISYTGISTKNPEEVTFRYRMKGLDDNWSNSTMERKVIFTDLPPGKYTFEVSAINADGVVSETPDRLEVNVVPTFLQSLFARIMFILLVLSLIVFLSMQIRRKVVERRVEQARQQAESYRLQLNSVIKQFDPHFTFNAVTSVGSLIMKGEKEKAYNYFIKLSNLLRSIISDRTSLLKPLEQEIEFVLRYCELQKLRFGSRFEYTITIAEDVDMKTPVPKMIIQSFAENAVKHGLDNKKGHGFLEISIINIENGIEVTVRDNGIGRAAAAELRTDGAGTGLKNIASIIETLNRANTEKVTFTLTDLVAEGTAAGTEVKIFLPYNYSMDFPVDTDKLRG